MSTPQTLIDFELPLYPIGCAALPSFAIIEVEGTAEQLPKLMARMLRLHGFDVTVIEQEQPKEEK